MSDGSSKLDDGESLSSSSASRSSAVQVAVRVRPLSASEMVQASESCVQTAGASTVVLGDKQYDFDAAFAPHVEQQHVYEQLVAPLVERFFDGYNATVFAYGQTGSGKTYVLECSLASYKVDPVAVAAVAAAGHAFTHELSSRLDKQVHNGKRVQTRRSATRPRHHPARHGRRTSSSSVASLMNDHPPSTFN